MYKHLFLAAALASVALVSCSKDDEDDGIACSCKTSNGKESIYTQAEMDYLLFSTCEEIEIYTNNKNLGYTIECK